VEASHSSPSTTTTIIMTIIKSRNCHGCHCCQHGAVQLCQHGAVQLCPVQLMQPPAHQHTRNVLTCPTLTTA
jgi:hypothetical protein